MFNERNRRCAAVQRMLSTDPSYDRQNHRWIATNNRDVMKTKFPATVMVFGVVSSEGLIMPPHILEVGLKVNTKVYLDVLKSVVIPRVQSGGRWQTLGVAAGLDASPQVQRDLGLASEGVLRLCTSSLTGPLLSSTWTCWTTSLGHTSRTSPTWPLTIPKPAWSPTSTEHSPSSRRHLWKRHAPSSISVSRWWLRLKAATLNRCQLYYIIKLPELIFSIKVLK